MKKCKKNKIEKKIKKTEWKNEKNIKKNNFIMNNKTNKNPNIKIIRIKDALL